MFRNILCIGRNNSHWSSVWLFIMNSWGLPRRLLRLLLLLLTIFISCSTVHKSFIDGLCFILDGAHRILALILGSFLAWEYHAAILLWFSTSRIFYLDAFKLNLGLSILGMTLDGHLCLWRFDMLRSVLNIRFFFYVHTQCGIFRLMIFTFGIKCVVTFDFDWIRAFFDCFTRIKVFMDLL